MHHPRSPRGPQAAMSPRSPRSPASRRPVCFRSAWPTDMKALLQICLLTGDEGEDASEKYQKDPDALGESVCVGDQV